MGKKGRRATQIRQPEDFVLSILQLSGLVIIEDDATMGRQEEADGLLRPRIQLIRALQKLSGLLQDSRIESMRVEDDASCAYLLQLEQRLQQLRDVDLPDAVSSNDRDTRKLLILKQGLESSSASELHLNHEPSNWSWVLLGYSLVAALLQQLSEERSVMATLERELGTIFLGSDGQPRNRAIGALASAIMMLERVAILANPAYADAVNRLERAAQPTAEVAPPIDNLAGCTVAANRKTSIEVGGRRRRDELHCRIPAESTVVDTIRQFILSPTDELCPVTALLVVGDEGSGKSYICERTLRLAMNKCTVIRPNVPLDFLGRTVGETEHRIVTVLDACISCSGKSILILDDIEHLLGTAGDENASTTIRWRRSFLAAIDYARGAVPADSSVLLLCTSKEHSTVLSWRFDYVFYLELPGDDARRDLLVDVLDIREQLDGVPDPDRSPSLRDLLDSIVVSTAGRSYAEIVQCCRHALTGTCVASSPFVFALDVLMNVKERLTSLTPVSLRGGELDNYVDMRVLSVRDLLYTVDGAEFVHGEGFPFRGSAAAAAWKDLQATIAIPLCRSRELDGILDCSGSGAKRALAGGVLLAGPSCSGKSALARHCAKYAAWMSPSVKLLDVSCTSLIHKELGGSEKAVHYLFQAARRASPCIIVMDGLENVAAVRGNDPTTEGTLDRVLSTFLVELDGAEDCAESEHCSIAIIGTTCNELWIDAAVRRPGRLGKTIRLTSDWDRTVS